MGRYSIGDKFWNEDELYRDVLEGRGVKRLEQYRTQRVGELSIEDKREIETEFYTWKVGDRLYKLAYERYGRSDLWWVILWYNGKPTESHIEIGETIEIPSEVFGLLELWGRG